MGKILPATVTFLWTSSVSFFLYMKGNKKSVGFLTSPESVNRNLLCSAVMDLALGRINGTVCPAVLPLDIKWFPVYLPKLDFSPRIDWVLFSCLLKGT